MFVICLGRMYCVERIVEDGRKDASRKDENTDGDRASISCVDFVVPIDAIVIKFAGRNFSIACRLGSYGSAISPFCALLGEL